MPDADPHKPQFSINDLARVEKHYLTRLELMESALRGSNIINALLAVGLVLAIWWGWTR